MCTAFPRSEYYQRVRLPPSLLSSSGWSIRLTYSARFLPSKTAVDLPGAMTLPFLSMPSLRPRRSLRRPSPFTVAYFCLPDFRPCRPPGVSRGSIASLALRPDIALSTLNSCRCLHEPKTRFPVGRLFPFPGRESHPLKAPGLTWRTEIGTEICIDNFSMASVDQFVDVLDCVQCAAVFPIGILFRLQVGFENRFEHQDCRRFRHSVADSGYP